MGEKKRELSRERDRTKCGSDHTRELKWTLSKSRQMKVSTGIDTAVKEGIEEMVVYRYRY